MAAARIVVDELRPYPGPRVGPFGGGRRSCHLMVEGDSPADLERLHEFARRIGLLRSWFQAHPLHPHYDLTPSKREAALREGAAFVPGIEQARARVRRRRERLGRGGVQLVEPR